MISLTELLFYSSQKSEFQNDCFSRSVTEGIAVLASDYSIIE